MSKRTLYAVRLDDHTPVGFFYALSLAELSMMVDEDDCDPAICEYHTVNTSGAIRWPDNDDWKMGEQDDRPSDKDWTPELEDWIHKREEKISAGVSFCRGMELGLGEYLYGQNIKGWKRLLDYERARIWGRENRGSRPR